MRRRQGSEKQDTCHRDDIPERAERDEDCERLLSLFAEDIFEEERGDSDARIKDLLLGCSSMKDCISIDIELTFPHDKTMSPTLESN